MPGGFFFYPGVKKVVFQETGHFQSHQEIGVLQVVKQEIGAFTGGCSGIGLLTGGLSGIGISWPGACRTGSSKGNIRD